MSYEPPSQPPSYRDMVFIGTIVFFSATSFVALLGCVFFLLRDHCPRVRKGCCRCCKKELRCCDRTRYPVSVLLFFALFLLTGGLLYGVVISPSMFDRYPPIASSFLGVLPLFLPAALLIVAPRRWWLGSRAQKRVVLTNGEESEPEGDDEDYSRYEDESIMDETMGQRLKMLWMVLLLALVLAVAMSFVLAYVSAGLCVSSQPDHITSRFVRQHYTKSICPSQGVCHRYVTLPEDCAHDMIVSYHTPRSCRSSVSYAPGWITNASLLTLLSTNGNSLKMVELEADIDRWVHFVALSDLQPDTVYSFAVDVSCDRQEDIYQFRTCPDNASQPLPLIFGGDCGTSSHFGEFGPVIIEAEPYAAVIGGDMAYANSFPQCYLVWDEWLATWQQHMTHYSPDGLYKLLTPMTLAIGNHEAGGWVRQRHEVAFYFNYFLQQLDGITDLADVAQRSSYHYHQLNADTVVVILDTYITAAVDGEQLQWLTDLFEPGLGLFADFANKIASYHNPLYPSSRTFDGWQAVLEREVWAPVFEQYGFRVNFEHHDHTFKRTQPLLSSAVNQTAGIIYLGDGSFGVSERTPNSDNSNLFLKRSSERHIWRVIVTPNSTSYTALATDSTIVNQFSLP